MGWQNIRRQFNNRKSAAVGWRACVRGRGHHALAGAWGTLGRRAQAKGAPTRQRKSATAQRLTSRSCQQRCEAVRLRLHRRLCCGSRSGVRPNSPKFDAVSSARGGEESQRLGLGSADVSRWAAGETPMGVGSKARLSPPAAGSLPRPGVAPPLG